jgi:hypothetical protein
MRRAVVAAEDDQRALGDARLFQRLHHPADIAVQVGNHRGVAGARTGMRQIAALPAIHLAVPIQRESLQRLAGRMHGDVRLDKGQV